MCSLAHFRIVSTLAELFTAVECTLKDLFREKATAFPCWHRVTGEAAAAAAAAAVIARTALE